MRRHVQGGASAAHRRRAGGRRPGRGGTRVSAPPLPTPVAVVIKSDLALLQSWSDELRDRGWSPTSVHRACARVSAFARATTTRGRGLLSATRHDLYTFAKQRAAARGLT